MKNMNMTKRAMRKPYMGGATLILFCFSLLYIITTSTAVDTITANQTIRDGDTIISAGGEFEMGFFSPGNSSKNRYFGIWYKKISSGKVIWVANREIPLTNSSGIIRVNDKGIALLSNGSSNSIFWSSNSSRSAKNPVAQLLDTGNLVFRDENESGAENIIWQSFDYPSDNFLPGMKFGVDLVNGIDRRFTPWKSADDPSPGGYIHRVDPNGYPQLLLWKGPVLSYRTGPWVGAGFSGIPRQKPNGVFTTMFVITPQEIYYKFDLINSSSAVTRIELTPDGVSRRLLWNERNQEWAVFLTLQVSDCDQYGLCGAYGACNINDSPRCECLPGFHPKSPSNWEAADWTEGCVRNDQLECGKGEGFVKYSGVKLPDTQHSWYNLSMGIEECGRVCLKNCSCMAYSNTDIRGGGSGCMLWFGDLLDIRGYSDDGQDLYVRMPPSELNVNKNSRAKKHVLVIVVPILVVITILLCLFLFILYAKKRRLRREGIVKLNSRVDASSGNEREEWDLPIFDFIQIENATNNFSNNNKLGQGGFGPVYQGKLDDGQEIAVKRLSKESRQGIDEFKNEVSCIAKLQHRNLVKLLGCCIDNGERMLIYEYLPNKSLDAFIFGKENHHSLDWPTRHSIINGIARGLLYLHQDSRLRIIHRDLKASNILLDYEMNPKISDFGMARIFGGNETEASTTRVVGTYGYMPPEYAIEGLFSVKSDVYSFGVLVLEIVSGTRNRGFHHPDHNLNLLGHVWRGYAEGDLMEVIDKTIMEESRNEHEVLRVIQIGLLCVQQYPEDRPDMSSVVLMLTSKIALPTPTQPGFFSERNPHQADSSSTKHESSSSNLLTVTYFAPR